MNFLKKVLHMIKLRKKFLFFIILIIIFILKLENSNNDEIKIETQNIIKNEIKIKIKDLKRPFRRGVANITCSNNKKYIRFECLKQYCSGWADRLKGILSTYIWSLLTNREFSIDVMYPCPLINMLEPNEIKWKTNIKCYDYINDSINFQSNDQFSIRSIFKITDRNFLNKFYKLNLINYYSDVNLLVMYINHDYIKPMSMNPDLEDKILKLGFVNNVIDFKFHNMFRSLYFRLFKLSASLEKKFETFKSLAKPNEQSKLICAQVRIGGVRPNVAFDKKFTDRNNSILFWNFIRETFLSKMNDDNYKIFITSDTENIVDESIKEFGIDKIIYIDGDYGHIDRLPKMKSCKRVEKTILDLHALQLCDMAVISQGEYGLTGVSLRENPYKDLYRFSNTKNGTNYFLKINSWIDLES